MNLGAVVEAHLQASAGAGMARLVAELGELDRYPASAGLEQAALRIAEHAEQVGLAEVDIHRWTVDGEVHRWWRYGAPASWTPRSAHLRHAGRPVVDYPADAFGLALNSAPLAPERRPLRAQDHPDVQGAVVLVTDPRPGGALWESLAARGAAAAVCSPDHDTAPEGVTQRVELRPRTSLAVFSVPPEELRRLLDSAEIDVDVAVDAGPGASMPVFTAVVPGVLAGPEVVLHAHLDHPRPSANDNASGVVAVLEVARLLRNRPPGRTVRVLCGPEFSGSAAWLHDRVATGEVPGIAAVLNLDTVGVDTALMQAPLAIERAPADLPDVASAALRLAFEALPPRARSYGGSQPVPAMRWYSAGFVGASDHLVFADSDPRRTVTALSQHPDPLRHTSGDTAQRVDTDQLALVCAATAAAAGLLADRAGAGMLRRAVLAAAMHDLGAALQRRLAGRPLSSGATGRIDPDDPARSSDQVTAVGAATTRNLDWIDAVVVDAGSDSTGSDPAGFDDRQARLTLAAAVDGTLSVMAVLAPPAPAKVTGGPEPAGVLRRAWPGPFSLVDALADLPAAVRDRCWTEIGRDRGGAYARLVALALAVDGRRTCPEVIGAAAFSCGTVIDTALACAYLEALRGAGWLAEVPACT